MSVPGSSAYHTHLGDGGGAACVVNDGARHEGDACVGCGGYEFLQFFTAGFAFSPVFSMLRCDTCSHDCSRFMDARDRNSLQKIYHLCLSLERAHLNSKLRLRL